MTKNIIQRALTFLTSAAMLGMGLMPVMTRAQAAMGVTISPPSYEVTVAPGETVTKTLGVQNDSSGIRSFTTTVNNFSAMDEEGGMAFSPFGGLASWITVRPAEFNIAPGEGRVIEVTISAPQNAPPGGHYATVFAVAKAGAVEGTGSAIGQYIGANFLVNVTGQVRESASIIEFSTAKASYDQAEPMPFRLRVQNSGNTHIRPTGVVEIFRGSTKVTSVAVNSDGANVLPGTARRFSVSTDKTLTSGKYTARATLTFGGQTLSSQPVSFIVVGKTPLMSVIVVLAVAFVIALVFALRPRRPRER